MREKLQGLIKVALKKLEPLELLVYVYREILALTRQNHLPSRAAFFRQLTHTQKSISVYICKVERLHYI